MELDPISIDGDWADFDGEPYFVYTKGNMLGLCVIGAHEPCFSVSSFFSKNDDTYKSQYEKFSSLLASLKEKFEETTKNLKGGEQPMNEDENKEVVEEVVNPAEEEPAAEFEETPAEEEQLTVEAVVEIPTVEEVAAETPAEPSEFERLQQAFDTLQNSFNELQTKFDDATNRINEFNTLTEFLKEENAQLKAAVAKYEAAEAQAEVERKNTLVEKYEKVLEEEEINAIKDKINDFSYDELEGKLAIAFANKQMTGNEKQVKKVPLPEPEKSSFALLIEKYHK